MHASGVGTDDQGGKPAPRPAEFRFRGTHRALLSPLVRATLDHRPTAAGSNRRALLVVPSARPVAELTTALALAQELSWPLLVVCSHEVKAMQVRERLDTEGWQVDLVAANLAPAGSLRAHRDWSTPQHWAARQRSAIDTYRKRNLALAAARMCAVERLLFLDDDVRGVTVEDVRDGLAAFAGPGPSIAGRRDNRASDLPSEPPAMVGWPADPFPDNSVVCHARRDYADALQATFASAGVLLLDVERSIDEFFPPIYNEDCLFLFEHLARRQVAVGRDVQQEPYDPYADPLRVRWQEFGDVLGEGLFHLLHERAPVELATDPQYWRPVRAHRRLLLDEITDQLRRPSTRARTDARQRNNALHAMAEARSQLTRATADSLADFVVRWQQDRRTWQEFVRALPQRDTLPDALTYLGIPPWDLVTRPL